MIYNTSLLPILSRDGQALERVPKLAVKFAKGLLHVPYETARQRLGLFSLVRRRICGYLICIYKIMHGFLGFPSDTVVAAPTRILSRFTNSGAKPVGTNMRSAFE